MAKSPFEKAADSKRYNIGAIKRPKNYSPIKDKGTYMNPQMLSYFWQQLQNKYHELEQSIKSLSQEGLVLGRSAESIDTAQTVTNSALLMRRVEDETKQRQRVQKAIDEIELKGPKSDYGYCVETGEEIGIKRLLSRPETTVTVEVQEKRERTAKIHGAHLRASIEG